MYTFIVDNYSDEFILGTCVDKVNSFSCYCDAGFTGVRCEVDIDDCLLSPCVNGKYIDQSLSAIIVFKTVLLN